MTDKTTTELLDKSYFQKWITVRRLGIGFLILAIIVTLLAAWQRYYSQKEEALFNKKFSHGVESLNSRSGHARLAGVRILENLHKTAKPANQKLIRNLLFDSIHNRVGIVAKIHVETTIKALGELVSGESMSLEERRVELDMQELDLHDYELRQAKLQGANFRYANLQKVDFEGAKLQEADFWGAKLQEASLTKVDLQGAYLWGANLQGAWFFFADLQGANFQKTKFGMTDLTGANLANVISLTQEQLDEAIYEKGRPPLNLLNGLKIPEDRAYEWAENEKGKRRRRFVESGAWVYTMFLLYRQFDPHYQ